MKFKQYKWFNAEFKKKHTIYSYVCYAFMALVLICLFFFPQNLKMLNILFIVIAAVCWYMSYTIQKQDKRLKVIAQTKKVAAK